MPLESPVYRLAQYPAMLNNSRRQPPFISARHSDPHTTAILQLRSACEAFISTLVVVNMKLSCTIQIFISFGNLAIHNRRHCKPVRSCTKRLLGISTFHIWQSMSHMCSHPPTLRSYTTNMHLSEKPNPLYHQWELAPSTH
jgi:hypothetical protein